MNRRFFGVVVAALALVWGTSSGVAGQTTAASPTASAGARAESDALPRTPDGQPDLQGYWTGATYTPLERPEELADKVFFTEEEAAAYAQARLDRWAAQPKDSIHYDDVIWQGEPDTKWVSSLRTSMITDPPNGRIPPMTPEAQARAAARRAERQLYHSTDYQSRALSERCIIWGHEGPPMLPPGYFANYQFVQGPGYVVIIQEMTHNTRVVPLDGSPHLADGIRQYSGDSRGRWEGDTLVVETRNLSDFIAWRGSTADMKVTERFKVVDADTILYEFTVDDPKTWTQPWTAEFPITRMDTPVFEYACHEGNYGLKHILSALRVEADAADASR